MVKTIVFDLHFTSGSIQALTDRGRAFLGGLNEIIASPAAYAAATDAGLHATFEDAGVRDWVTEFKLGRSC